MKIQAEYNQLIDIELPPPPHEGCLTVSIDSIGVTIRIRERAEAPSPQRNNSNPFSRFIIDTARAADIEKRLHALIDGKTPKLCALTILAAIDCGLLTQPTYSALRAEFPEIGSRPNYAYYLDRSQNYKQEIASIGKNL